MTKTCCLITDEVVDIPQLMMMSMTLHADGKRGVVIVMTTVEICVVICDGGCGKGWQRVRGNKTCC